MLGKRGVTGIPVFIYEEIIACVLGTEASGKYSGIDIPNTKTSPWNDIVNMTLFNSKQPGKYNDLSMKNKMLLKIQ